MRVTCAADRFDQMHHAEPEDPKRNWTLCGDFGVIDVTANPIRWFANLPLMGNNSFRVYPLAEYHVTMLQSGNSWSIQVRAGQVDGRLARALRVRFVAAGLEKLSEG